MEFYIILLFFRSKSHKLPAAWWRCALMQTLFQKRMSMVGKRKGISVFESHAILNKRWKTKPLYLLKSFFYVQCVFVYNVINYEMRECSVGCGGVRGCLLPLAVDLWQQTLYYPSHSPSRSLSMSPSLLSISYSVVFLSRNPIR